MSYTYTVVDFKAELEPMLHGTTLDSVSNFFGALNRAQRILKHDVDLQETKVTALLANPIFTNVYNYTCPSDLKMDKIIDLRPQFNRKESDRPWQTTNVPFDLRKQIEDNTLTIEHINRTKTLRINKYSSQPLVVESLSTISGNGTWAVGGDATNLTEDTNEYVTSGGSLNFDLDGATTAGYIENSTFTQVDLSDHEDKSSLFVYVYVPDSTKFTSVELRWGSSSSDYWSRTSTSPFYGSVVTGWNLFRFDWNGATETGTPVASAIDYARLTYNYDGTVDTDVRFNNLVSVNGMLQEVMYYSANIFQDASTSAYKETSDSDNDIILLEETTIIGLLFKTAEICAQQIQEQGGSIDVQYFKQEYELWKRRYKRNYNSENLKAKTYYYKVSRR